MGRPSRGRRFAVSRPRLRRFVERNGTPPPARYAPGFGLGPGDACVPNDAGTPFPTREPTLDPTASPSAPPATFPANRSCGVIVMKGNDQNTVECETTPTEGPRPRRLSHRRGRGSKSAPLVDPARRRRLRVYVLRRFKRVHALPPGRHGRGRDGYRAAVRVSRGHRREQQERLLPGRQDGLG